MTQKMFIQANIAGGIVIIFSTIIYPHTVCRTCYQILYEYLGVIALELLKHFNIGKYFDNAWIKVNDMCYLLAACTAKYLTLNF